MYSPALDAFLKTDLSFCILDGPFDQRNDSVPLECSWLMMPVPLQCHPGNVEATFSATKLVCIGRESFVFACARNPMYELSVIKSLVRPDAARRIQDLLYEANMPQVPDYSEVLCPVLFKSYSTLPALAIPPPPPQHPQSLPTSRVHPPPPQPPHPPPVFYPTSLWTKPRGNLPTAC
jgi:hypothetical protein